MSDSKINFKDGINKQNDKLKLNFIDNKKKVDNATKIYDKTFNINNSHEEK